MSALQKLTVDEFLERTHYMPAQEAIHEMEMRLDNIGLERALVAKERQRLTSEGRYNEEFRQLGYEIEILNLDGSRISRALKNIHTRLDRATWSAAVRAVYGDEGYVAVRTWMIQNDPETPDIKEAIDRLIAKNLPALCVG